MTMVTKDNFPYFDIVKKVLTEEGEDVFETWRDVNGWGSHWYISLSIIIKGCEDEQFAENRLRELLSMSYQDRNTEFVRVLNLPM